MTSVVILDYGSGNVRSAQRAVETTGATVSISADFDEAMNCDALLVPGVGAFASCMAGLKNVRGDQIIGGCRTADHRCRWRRGMVTRPG